MYFWQQISETSNSYLGWYAYLLGSYWCILWFLMILTNCSVYGTRIVRVNYWAIQNFVLHSVWTKKNISWWKKTHAICHNGLFWSNPFFVNFATSTRDANPGGFLHIALLQICPRTYVQQIGKMRCGICASRYGPHAVAGHTCTTYAKIVGRGHGNQIFWAFLLMIQHKISFYTCHK